MRPTRLLAMRILCVAEKPSIAKSVASSLGGGSFSTRNSKNKYVKNYDFTFNFPQWGSCHVTITSVLGHLNSVDFPEAFRKWTAVPPAQLFHAPVATTVSKDMSAVADNIQRESRNADKLFIWTDCDREGEHIGWEVVQIARAMNRRLTDADIKRATFNNVDPGHLREAAVRPVDLDMRVASAVQGRIELDLRLGAAFTRFQTLALQGSVAELEKEVISYGSCQFPTLGFVVDRYKRVRDFVAEPFWYIALTLKKNETAVNFTWDRGHLMDRLAATVLYERCLDASSTATITSVVQKPTSKWRPLPLTTVDLQKQGARYLRMSSKKIMDIAEKLYTQGYISYPRTETDRFDEAIDLQKLIKHQEHDNVWGNYAKGLLDGKFAVPKKGKHDDKAHPPIHPVKGAANNVLQGEQHKVYEFVTRRFLACCSEDAKGFATTAIADWAGEKFTASGLVVTERNFLDVYPYITWETSKLPELVQGEVLPVSSAKLKDGKTSPPSYLTEPELIGLMDVNGIGTDATMAEHIEKVISRGYVIKHSANQRSVPYMIPSNLGIALVEGYDKIGFDLSLTKPFLRKEMEVMMGRVCRGDLTQQQFVDETVRKYEGVFALANREKRVLVSTVKHYLTSGDAN